MKKKHRTAKAAPKGKQGTQKKPIRKTVTSMSTLSRHCPATCSSRRPMAPLRTAACQQPVKTLFKQLWKSQASTQHQNDTLRVRSAFKQPDKIGVGQDQVLFTVRKLAWDATIVSLISILEYSQRHPGIPMPHSITSLTQHGTVMA